MKALMWCVCLALTASALDVQASRRLGGGQSIGQQSPRAVPKEAVAAPNRSASGQGQQQASPGQGQPQAVPGQPSGSPAPVPAQGMAPQGASQGAAPVRPASSAHAPQSGARPWGGVLAGLAAGLGLAWLAHALGLGEAFGAALLLGLVALVLLMALGLWLRARRPALALAGDQAVRPAVLPDYSPDKVGNDASARPWERSSMSFDAARYADARSGVRIGSALSGGGASSGVPPGFDTKSFLDAARRNFVTMQKAWDRADLATLRAMMTDRMVLEIQAQLAEREAALGGGINHTEVVMLEAELLGIDDLGDAYLASVEYSGMIREDEHAGPSPFREIWNMSKPKDGSSGWLVAGVQALQ